MAQVKVSVSFRIEPEIAAAMDRLARVTGMTRQAIAETAISQYLKRRAQAVKDAAA